MDKSNPESYYQNLTESSDQSFLRSIKMWKSPLCTEHVCMESKSSRINASADLQAIQVLLR